MDIQKELQNRYCEVAVNTLVEQIKNSMSLQAKVDLCETIIGNLQKEKIELTGQVEELSLRPTQEAYDDMYRDWENKVASKDRLLSEMSENFTKKMTVLNQEILTLTKTVSAKQDQIDGLLADAASLDERLTKTLKAPKKKAVKKQKPFWDDVLDNATKDEDKNEDGGNF
jgi:hypothetical protein